MPFVVKKGTSKGGTACDLVWCSQQRVLDDDNEDHEHKFENMM